MEIIPASGGGGGGGFDGETLQFTAASGQILGAPAVDNGDGGSLGMAAADGGNATGSDNGGNGGAVEYGSGDGGNAEDGDGGEAGGLSFSSGSGGSSETGNGGNGEDITFSAGNGGLANAGTGDGGAGANIIYTAGTGGTSVGGDAGIGGALIDRSIRLSKQPTPVSKTVSGLLTAADLRARIIKVNQGATGASAQQLPEAEDFEATFHDLEAGDSWDFSVINTSTVVTETATITTNTGWTLTDNGSMLVPAYSAAGLAASGLFRAVYNAAGDWSLYRVG